VGQVVYLHVAFSASSPFGEVTEMRVKQGAPWFTNVDWEPFAPFKSYPWTIIANWAPLRINAQFRDQNGNLSPIYWDEIQQEGFCSITMTPSITRTPAVTSSFPIAPVLLYRGSLGWIH
jgi:hypothetical protein